MKTHLRVSPSPRLIVFPTTPLSLALLIAAFVIQHSSFVIAQGGSLTPPGAPAPTMKTLDQLEPRTPISSLPFTISTAGSYFVTGNLTGSQGIAIDADHVTLDLGGFALADSGGGGNGVRILNSHDNITIRNGTVRNWGGDGVVSFTSDSTEVRVENLRVISSGFTGILLNDNSTVVNCEARGNPGRGISVGASCKITGCTTTGQTGANGIGIECGGRAVVSGCVSSGNSSSGIKVGDGSVVTDCVVQGNAGANALIAGSGCSITHCTVQGNTNAGAASAGISAASGTLISRCVVTATLSTAGALSGSTGAGISLASDCTVEHCIVQACTGDGIRVSNFCRVTENQCHGNGASTGDGAGIHAINSRNRIVGNSIVSNDRGIDVDGSLSLVFKNTASVNTINYDIVTNNFVGPIVIPSPSAAINSNVALASSLGTTDPWANFSD